MIALAWADNIRVVFCSVIPVDNYTSRAEWFFLTRSPEKILALNEWLQVPTIIWPLVGCAIGTAACPT